MLHKKGSRGPKVVWAIRIMVDHSGITTWTVNKKLEKILLHLFYLNNKNAINDILWQ